MPRSSKFTLVLDCVHELHDIFIKPFGHISERDMPAVGIINPRCVADMTGNVICIRWKNNAVVPALNNQGGYGQGLHQFPIIYLALEHTLTRSR